jgi:hypothetical protein
MKGFSLRVQEYALRGRGLRTSVTFKRTKVKVYGVKRNRFRFKV